MTSERTIVPRPSHVFVVIILVAAALRFAFIADHSLWVDELFSLKFAQLSLPKLVAEVAEIDNHPPLYYVLLRAWIKVLGESEFALRSLSAVFGLLTVAVVYRLGATLYDVPTGLRAALLVAVAKFAIYWSQDARMYSLLMLLAAASTYFFWLLLQDQSARKIFGYLVSTVLLLYTHSYGVFIVAAHNGYLLLTLLLRSHHEFKLTPLRWIALQTTLLLLFVPWVSVLLARASQLRSEGFWVQRPTLLTVAGTVSEFAGSGPALRLVLAILVAIAAGSLALPILRARRARDAAQAHQTTELRATALLLWCLLTPMLVPFLVSMISTPIYVNRAVGAGFFAFALLSARGVAVIRPPLLSHGIFAAAVALSLATVAVPGYVHTDKFHYREAANFVASRLPPTAWVVTCGDGHLSWPFSHYAQKTGLNSRILDLNDEQIDDGSWRIAQHKPELWLVTLNGKREAVEACKRLPPLLQRNYPEEHQLDIPIPGFGIRVFRSAS